VKKKTAQILSKGPLTSKAIADFKKISAHFPIAWSQAIFSNWSLKKELCRTLAKKMIEELNRIQLLDISAEKLEYFVTYYEIHLISLTEKQLKNLLALSESYPKVFPQYLLLFGTSPKALQELLISMGDSKKFPQDLKDMEGER
jgi:hypothetical protein